MATPVVCMPPGHMFGGPTMDVSGDPDYHIVQEEENIDSSAARRRRMQLRRTKVAESNPFSANMHKRLRLLQSPPALDATVNESDLCGTNPYPSLPPSLSLPHQHSSMPVSVSLLSDTQRQCDTNRGRRKRKSRDFSSTVGGEGDGSGCDTFSSSGSESSSEIACARLAPSPSKPASPSSSQESLTSLPFTLPTAPVLKFNVPSRHTRPPRSIPSSNLRPGTPAAQPHLQPRVSAGSSSDECPSFGQLSLCGRRREMEDAVATVPSLIHLPGEGGGDAGEQLHFFGVYDGHGGCQVASYCSTRMHEVVIEELHQKSEADRLLTDEAFVDALTTSFLRVDAELNTQPQGPTDPDHPTQALAPETVGSTSVVAIVSPTRIVVANTGDSRAVLSTGGKALPLSTDHKPDREDEKQRIESVGGRVIYWNGYRVLGVLAMSRAIGDRYLKPSVIPDPDVTVTQRSAEDECIILASDGLWDVMSNEVACDVARRCLDASTARRDFEADASLDEKTLDAKARREPTNTAIAAAVLTKLALARGSEDNISVVVVDLKENRGRP